MNDDYDVCEYCGQYFDPVDLFEGLCHLCEADIEAEWEVGSYEAKAMEAAYASFQDYV